MRRVLALGIVVVAQSLQFPVPGIRHIELSPRWNEPIRPKVFQRKIFYPNRERPCAHSTLLKSMNQGNAPEDDKQGEVGKQQNDNSVFGFTLLRTAGRTLSISEFPDSVLREAMEIDKNHDGLLDISEISEALNSLSQIPSDKPSGQALRELIDQCK